MAMKQTISRASTTATSSDEIARKSRTRTSNYDQVLTQEKRCKFFLYFPFLRCQKRREFNCVVGEVVER